MNDSVADTFPQPGDRDADAGLSHGCDSNNFAIVLWQPCFFCMGIAQRRKTCNMQTLPLCCSRKLASQIIGSQQGAHEAT